MLTANLILRHKSVKYGSMINHYKLIYLPDVHFLSAEVNTVILNQTFWQILTRNSVWRNTAKCSVFKTAVHFHQFKIIYNFQAERFRKGRCKIVGEAHRWGHKAKDAGTSLNVPKRDGQAQRWTFTLDTPTVSYYRKTSLQSSATAFSYAALDMKLGEAANIRMMSFAPTEA